MDLRNLSEFAQKRIESLYDSVRDIVMADEANYNNWVRSQMFSDRDEGLEIFAENLAMSVSDGDISWYEDDERIIEWLVPTLRVADFLYS